MSKNKGDVAQINFLENINLYVYPNNIKIPSCANCGGPNHVMIFCKAPTIELDGNRKFFKKIYIPKERTQFTQNQDISNNYGHIVQMNKSLHRNNNKTTNTDLNVKHPLKSNASQRGRQNPAAIVPSQVINNQHTDYIELRNRLVKAERTIEFLTNKLNENEEKLKQFDNSQQQLQKDHKIAQEKQLLIDNKLDAILERILQLAPVKPSYINDYDPIAHNTITRSSNERISYSEYSTEHSQPATSRQQYNEDSQKYVINAMEEDYNESNYDTNDDNHTVNEEIVADENGPKGIFSYFR